MVKTENIVEAAKRQGLNKFTAIVLVLLHIAAIAALFRFSWKALADCRRAFVLHDHRPRHQHGISPAAHAPVLQSTALAGIFLRAFGTLTLEGGPIFWVATHRCTTSSPISPATRIPRAMARSGPTWAGFSGARPTTTTPK